MTYDEIYQKVLEYISLYFDRCPIAPYTEYILFSISTLILFFLWRSSVAHSKSLQAQLTILKTHTTEPTKHFQKMTELVEKNMGAMKSTYLSALESIENIVNTCHSGKPK